MPLIERLKRLLRMNAEICQPIPQVTPDNVERVVSREFAVDKYAAVTAMLGEFGTETRHREPSRVQLAAIKKANGSVRKVRAYVDSAKRDYRDTLAAAKYRADVKIGFRIRELPEKERRRIIDEDWRQYEERLKK